MAGGHDCVAAEHAQAEETKQREPMMKPYGYCVYCGGEVIERREQVDYRFHGQLYILENVPTGVCSQCGEQVFTAEVAKRMEAAVEQAQGDVRTIPIAVIGVK